MKKGGGTVSQKPEIERKFLIVMPEEEMLAAAFGVQSIPTLVVIKNGVVTETAVGARPKAAILAMLA